MAGVTECLTGVILAGGRSQRMGRDKAVLPWGSQTLLEHAVDLIRPWVGKIWIVTNDPERHRVSGAGVLVDPVPFLGPLAALASALAKIGEGSVLVLACDMPAVTGELMAALVRLAKRHPDQAVVTRDSTGWQPLCGVYPWTVREAMQRLVARGHSAMHDLMGVISPVPLSWSDEALRNVNTPEDYEWLGRSLVTVRSG